ncbi:hypothetical protein KC19_2G116800, partial [Ceratodon purpureus]
RHPLQKLRPRRTPTATPLRTPILLGTHSLPHPQLQVQQAQRSPRSHQLHPRLTTSLAGRRGSAGGRQGRGGPADQDDHHQGRHPAQPGDQRVREEVGVRNGAHVGVLVPRPELERRPETGSKNFFSVFAFDGAAPETINCRLAMLGFVRAVVVERMTGQTVFKQVTNAGQLGLLYSLGAVQLFTYASLVPIMSGESTDARSFGPFTARAERWNGRIAMLGFLGLVITEAFTHSAVFRM